jgi:hypothetical protein
LYDPDEDDEDVMAYEYEFELMNSEDGHIVTLVCHSNKMLEPCEYAEALRTFADRIDSIVTMAEVGNTLN